jgi:hypothetical protein
MHASLHVVVVKLSGSKVVSCIQAGGLKGN